jgi:hypothetical protein
MTLYCKRKTRSGNVKEAQGIADYQRIISTGLTDKQLQYESIKAERISRLQY